MLRIPDGIHIHREQGWWFPLGDNAEPGVFENIKKGILDGNGAKETGLERIVGLHKGIPFEANLGEHFVDREDGHDYGIVFAIVELNPDLLGVITSRRGFRRANPVLVGKDELLHEIAYAVELSAWEKKQK